VATAPPPTGKWRSRFVYAFYLLPPLLLLALAIGFALWINLRPTPEPSIYIKPTISFVPSPSPPPQTPSSGASWVDTLVTLPGYLATACGMNGEACHGYTVEGSIYSPTGPLMGATVWISAQSERGAPFSVPVQRTDAQGAFPKVCIREKLVDDPTARINIATYIAPSEDLGPGCQGAEESPACNTAHVQYDIDDKIPTIRKTMDGGDWRFIAFAAFVFFMGITARLLRTPLGRAAKFFGVFSVLTFMCVIAGFIGLIHSHVVSETMGTELLFTKVGYVTRGTYAADVPVDWVFSLSMPFFEMTGDDKLLRGLGAPLWAILVSTVGAAVHSLMLLTGLLKPPPNADRKPSPINRVEMLLHIAFAPVSAIVIYPMLVWAGITGFVVTFPVLLVAGLSLGPLVREGARRLETVLDKYRQQPSGDGNKGRPPVDVKNPVKGSIEIKATPEVGFGFVKDPQNLANLQPALKTTTQSGRVQASYELGKRTCTLDGAWRTHDEQKRVEWTVDGDLTGDLTVSASGSGCRIDALALLGALTPDEFKAVQNGLQGWLVALKERIETNPPT
jgi:hypothetical protein